MVEQFQIVNTKFWSFGILVFCQLFATGCVSTVGDSDVPEFVESQPTEQQNSLGESAVAETGHSTKIETVSGSENLDLINRNSEDSLADSNCIPLPEGHIAGQPIVVEEGKVVITRFMKSCVTKSGQSGVVYDSPYTAMGVPCAGGVGKVDWKGYYANPKVVQLTFSNDCKMTTLKNQDVQNQVMEVLRLQSTNQMLALNPLAVQFWELPDGKDADVGYHLTLRSNRAKQVIWPLMKKGDPVEVRLYGRENSWGSSNQFYKVEGRVKLSGTNKFQFDVKNIQPLTEEQLVELKNLCFSLEPKRDCSRVFGY